MRKISILIVFFITLIGQLQINDRKAEVKKGDTIKIMEDSTKYGLHGKLTAQEGKGNELVKILLEAASLMKSAKGCHLYVVGISQDKPDEVWITEIWERKEDHDNSLKMTGVRELIGKAIPILNGSPEKGQEWQILGGAGIE